MTILYEHYNTGDDGTYNTNDATKYLGQSFTPSVDFRIASIKLKLWKYGTPGTITAHIYATDVNGHPTGTALCTGTLVTTDITTDGGGDWYRITFSSSALLIATTKYAIVIKIASADANNYLGWRRDTSDPTYTEGYLIYSIDSGSSWNDVTTMDFMFEVYGTPFEVEKIIYVGTVDGKLKAIGDNGTSLGVVNVYDTGYSYTMIFVARDLSGNVYFHRQWGAENSIYKLDSNFNIVTSWATNGKFVVQNPHDIDIDKNGYLVIGTHFGWVKLLDPSGVELWSTHPTLWYCNAVKFTPSGDILVAVEDNQIHTGFLLSRVDGSIITSYDLINPTTGYGGFDVDININTLKVIIAATSCYPRQYSYLNSTPDWYVDIEAPAYQHVVYDSKNNVIYLCSQGTSGTPKKNVWKIDSDGNILASILLDSDENSGPQKININEDYEVVISSSNGLFVLDANLNVLRSFKIEGFWGLDAWGGKVPTITDQSDDTDIELGKEVELFVIAEGDPTPTYQWEKDDISISGEIDDTLSFYSDANSSGIYKCKASNVEGDIWSDPIVLTVIGNPYLYRLFDLFIDADRED